MRTPLVTQIDVIDASVQDQDHTPDARELIAELTVDNDILIFDLDDEILPSNDVIMSFTPSQHKIISENAEGHNLGETENKSENDADTYASNIPNAKILSSDDNCKTENSKRKVKRHRKRKSEKETWDYNKNKYKRMRGLDYKGKGKSEGGKSVFNKHRPARSLLPSCNCKQSAKGKTLKCKEFSQESR